MIRMDKLSKIIVVGHQLNREDRIRNSLVKFIMGGVAMFMRLERSHQVVVIGRILWNPRVRIRMRVCVRS